MVCNATTQATAAEPEGSGLSTDTHHLTSAASAQYAPESDESTHYLPIEVIVAVLQRVDQPFRLNVCARVHSTWAAAAVAASSSIALSLTSASAAARHDRAKGFSIWLQHHHQQLHSLDLQGNVMSRPPLRLPCTVLRQLRQLSLSHCRVTLTVAEANIPGHGQHCEENSARPGNRQDTRTSGVEVRVFGPCLMPSLLELQLHGCVLDWGPSLQAATPAASFSDLQVLSLQQLLPGDLSRHQQQALLLLAPAAFQQMVHLQQLVLKQLNQYESIILAGLAAGLGGMQQLQKLRVDALQLTAPMLAELPSSIAVLELASAKRLSVSSTAVPRLTGLTALQDLSIDGVARFEPRLLTFATGLTALRIRSSSSRFLPDGTGGTQDLLAALQNLPLLEKLDLRNVLQHLLYDVLLQAYSGLTASGQLQLLDLSACRFPPNSASVLFHGSCCLRQLRQLVLYRCEDPAGSVLHVQDLRHLVACCPNLEELCMWLTCSSRANGLHTQSTWRESSDSSRAGTSSSSSNSGSSSSTDCRELQLLALQQLPKLTMLVAAGPGVTSEELEAAAQLKQLTSLGLYRCGPLSNAALLHLTLLTQLVTLAVDAHSCLGSWRGFEQYLLLQGHESKACEVAASCQPQSKQQSLRDIPVWKQLHNVITLGHVYDTMQAPAVQQ